MFGATVAEIKKWEVFYDTNSDFGEVDLERRVKLLQLYVTATNEVGNNYLNFFKIVVSAKQRYTKVETSGNYLKFDSEGDGSASRLQMSCRFGKDSLPRYEVRISDGEKSYNYRIMPRKKKK